MTNTLRTLLDIADCAHRLTVIGTTKDDQPVRGYSGGNIIIGPVGWQQLRETLDRLDLETRLSAYVTPDDAALPTKEFLRVVRDRIDEDLQAASALAISSK